MPLYTTAIYAVDTSSRNQRMAIFCATCRKYHSKMRPTTTSELSLHEFGILQTDPYCQIIIPDRILPYHTEPRTNEAHFKSSIQLRMPTTTQMEIIKSNITNITIVLYTFIIILLMVVILYALFRICIKYVDYSAKSSDTLYTYTELDTIDKRKIPSTITTTTQTASTSEKVTFVSTPKIPTQPIYHSSPLRTKIFTLI